MKMIISIERASSNLSPWSWHMLSR